MMLSSVVLCALLMACACADGNAETDDHDDGGALSSSCNPYLVKLIQWSVCLNVLPAAGTMEAIYFGSAKGGLNHGGAGAGPWIMADMENALWGADR